MSPALAWLGRPAEADAVAIADVVVDQVTTTSVRVSWTVLVGGSPAVAQGWVEYGTASGGSYTAETKHETSFDYSHHVQTVSGLQPGTPYFLRPVAVTVGGRTGRGEQASVTTEPIAATGSYPPDTTGLTYAATLPVPRPGYLSPIVDPQTGCRITRVTDTPGWRHRYSSKAAWNADQSLLLLDYPHLLLDGTTYAQLTGSLDTGDYFAWDATDPGRGWCGGGGNVFRRLSVARSGLSVAQAWALSDYASIDYGGGQGSPSDDGRYHAMGWRKASGAVGVLVFDAVAGSVVSEVQLGTGSSISSLIDSVCMSGSGDYVFVQGASVGSGVTQGSWVYHQDLSPSTRRFLTISTSHYDAGRLEDGTDVLVMTEQLVGGGTGGGSWTNTGRWVMSSGAWALTAATDYVYSHVSCRNTARWGWAYLSNYAPTGAFPGKDEVVAVKLDGSDTVERFCHSRTASETYALQTHACPSPTGDRVIFASPWGTSSTSDLYAYVTEAA